MTLGPIMLDLEGTELVPAERELLQHPLVGGVILFSRNFYDRDQLRSLVRDIHGVRQPPLLVAVDHEGGRVQRFRAPFTRLPAAARLGQLYDHDATRACRLAESCGWVMAVELRDVLIDFSFAPVLDLGHGRSTVIGDRALHRDPAVVAELGRRLMLGMQRGGMMAVGKHFPGHGTVEADSHVCGPVDTRPLETIRMQDMLPFERMIHYGLSALMPAHIVFPCVDSSPVGFSRIWLDEILRGQMGFQGALFSDDISMAGASSAGGYPDRVRAALHAGCDMVLVCHNRSAVVSLLAELEPYRNPVSASRLARMHGHGDGLRNDQLLSDGYRQAVEAITALETEPELDLQNDASA